MRGGQPSTTQPIAGPWLSPQVVTRNRWPKVLWAHGLAWEIGGEGGVCSTWGGGREQEGARRPSPRSGAWRSRGVRLGFGVLSPGWHPLDAHHESQSYAGRPVSLPAELRKKHGLAHGGEVIVEDAGDAIILRTVDQVVARAQAAQPQADLWQARRIG